MGAGAPFAAPRSGTVWRYALIGAGIGAVAGGVFALTFNHRAGLEGEDYGVITYIVLVPAGAVLGGGIGALVGGASQHQA